MYSFSLFPCFKIPNSKNTKIVYRLSILGNSIEKEKSSNKI